MGALPASNAAEDAEHLRLRGAPFAVARILWLALALPTVALAVAGLPYYYQRLLTPCADASSCPPVNGVLSARGLQYLTGQGVSASAYAALHTIYFAIIMAVWCVIGFLIFWRRSDDVIALVGAFFLVTFGLSGLNTFSYALGLAYPVLATALALLALPATLASIVFVVYFPSARSAPRWMLLIVALGVARLPVDLYNTQIPDWLYASIYLAFFGGVIMAQVYRYRQISTPSKRLQTKWVMVGITVATVAVIGLLILSAASPLLPVVNDPFLLGEVWTIVLSFASLAIPITVGVAILRYQLLDIDTLINKALVYGSLTGILAFLYLGLVIGAQSVFSNVTGQREQNPLIIVSSTLVIAGLFQPLRGRIQKTIDRRFYRAKYDAQKTLAAFSATLRQEVSLSELRLRLVGVVEETMRPTHVSLWLAEPQRKTSFPHNPAPAHSAPEGGRA
jgi:hypothetical protein